jgi:Na+/H+ antiporter NhaC
MKPTWWPYVLGVLYALIVALILVSLTVTTWRLIFPRQPTPTYVCVYVTERGSTTVTGSTPCAREAAA